LYLSIQSNTIGDEELENVLRQEARNGGGGGGGFDSPTNRRGPPQ